MKYVTRFALTGVLLATVVTYLPTLNDAFHGDDFVAFREFGRKDFWQYCKDVFFFKDNNFYWRPFGVIFHRLLYEGFGLDPFVFRLASLGFFLLTLLALYWFCLRERLNQAVAVSAVALFALYPNHSVSVAWVTNASRLMAVLFFLGCLLLLQSRWRPRLLAEAGAFALLVAAVLSDETSLALAPLYVLYAAFLRDDKIRWLPGLLRIAAVAALIYIVLPMQFDKTLDDEPRLQLYGLGPHVWTQTWALASQLTLPLAPAAPLDIYLATIGPVQWAAGLATLAAGAALMLFGSQRVRFLLVWGGLSLAPFTLWDLNYLSPRYVYMAAVPFAILTAWLLVQGITWLATRVTRVTGRLALPQRRWAPGLAPAVAPALLLLLSVTLFSEVTRERNATWSKQTAGYGLVAGLEEQMPGLPSGSRIVLLYSPLTDFWATTVLQTVFNDTTLRVADVPRERAEEQQIVFNGNDVVLYYLGDRLLPVQYSASRR